MRRKVRVLSRPNLKQVHNGMILWVSAFVVACTLLLSLTSPAYADDPEILHRVSAGENLYRISLRYGVPLQDILRANGLTNPHRLVAGWDLVIPQLPKPEAATTMPAENAPMTIHRVLPGENLYRLSLRYGVAIPDVLNANGLTDPHRVLAGQALVIPRADNTETEEPGQSVFTGVQSYASRWPPNGWVVESMTPTLRWNSNGYTHLRVQQPGREVPHIDVVVMPGQDSFAIPLATPLSPGVTYTWKVRTNPFSPASSPYTWSPWSAQWALRALGVAPWKDTAIVQLLSPGNGTITGTVHPLLRWKPPAGARQYQLQVFAAFGSVPSLSITRSLATSYDIPAAPVWYGMLPGMTYLWRVRVTDVQGYVPPDHPSWGPWSETWSFHTPQPASSTITPGFPAEQGSVSSVLPTLSWNNAAPDIFYYEIQISKDRDFVTDPAQARAAVYWEYRHGGVTTPLNSYTVSPRYSLEPGTTYYWRIRPRVEGSTTGVPWSPTWTFVTPRR